jgi:hypothetical protein
MLVAIKSQEKMSKICMDVIWSITEYHEMSAFCNLRHMFPHKKVI